MSLWTILYDGLNTYHKKVKKIQFFFIIDVSSLKLRGSFFITFITHLLICIRTILWNIWTSAFSLNMFYPKHNYHTFTRNDLLLPQLSHIKLQQNGNTMTITQLTAATCYYHNYHTLSCNMSLP